MKTLEWRLKSSKLHVTCNAHNSTVSLKVSPPAKTYHLFLLLKQTERAAFCEAFFSPPKILREKRRCFPVSFFKKDHHLRCWLRILPLLFPHILRFFLLRFLIIYHQLEEPIAIGLDLKALLRICTELSQDACWMHAHGNSSFLWRQSRYLTTWYWRLVWVAWNSVYLN